MDIVEQSGQAARVFMESHTDNSSKVERAVINVKHEGNTSPNQSLIAEKEDRVRLQCSECSRVYFSAEAMACHMRRHRGQNPFQCVMCEYNTYNKTMFMEHVNGHLGIKPYQCGKCNYRSVSKKYMKIHESKHATCGRCGHVARNSAKLTQHRLENGCGDQLCGNEKVSRSTRKKKIQQSDETNQLLEDSPSSDSEDSISPLRTAKGVYKCAPCKQQFTSRSELRAHFDTHNPCPKCNVQLPPKLLTKHMKEKHDVRKNVERKKFKCKICEFKANGLARILLHLIHHPQDAHASIDVTPLVESGFIKTN